MDACLGYITTKDKAQAQKIGRALVDKRLAACVNILCPMESIYRWEGKVEVATEAILLIKTIPQQKEKITSIIKALHSYDCPCVFFLDINGGNADYLSWLKSNSASTGA